MRKRSGALHSDSEQEFLLLAQLSHQKTGYFYDETVHSQLSKKIKKHHSPRNPKEQKNGFFHGFQFSAEDIYKQEERIELQLQTKTLLVSIVIVCDDQEEIKFNLFQLWPHKEDHEVESPETRKIDLFIVQAKDIKGQPRCFKFWIIEAKHIDNPLYASYLKRAVKIVNFSHENSIGEPHSLSEAKNTLFQLVHTLQY